MGSQGPFFGTLLWKLRQIITRGQIYDSALWLRHMQWFAKGLTFREAFQATGRVLNISCTPVRSPALAHLTSPHLAVPALIRPGSSPPDPLAGVSSMPVR